MKGNKALLSPPLTLPMKMITTEEGIRGRDCVRVPATHLW